MFIPSPVVRVTVARFVAALSVVCVASGSAAAQAPEYIPGPTIAEPPGTFTGQTYVRPELHRDAADGTAQRRSTFIVTYNGFSPQAQVAFQAAVDIWASVVQSNVPIRVTANWRTDLPGGVLGSAGPTLLVRDFANAPAANTYFPIALANARAGVDLYEGGDDITANFNAVYNWYLGTDGNPGQSFDLVTVVLHELGHGLGFFGSMNTYAGDGWWGVGSPAVPVGYDLLSINGSGQALIDTTLFANHSAALAAQLTSGNLYLNGAAARARNGGVAPVLFAPNPWQAGSSLSHLDDTVYPNGTPNSLMTHAVAPGEAVHDPGPITRGVLSDIGWTIDSAPATIPLSVSITQSGGGQASLIAGVPTAWIAGASGMTCPTFQYWIFNGTGWRIVREYSDDPVLRWTPSHAGSYVVQVWARNCSSTDVPYQMFQSTSVLNVAAPAAVAMTQFVASPSPPAQTGATVTWQASAVGGVGPLQYEFWLLEPGTGWRVLRSWSSTSNVSWTPTRAGSYSVQAWVRSAGSTAPYEAWRDMAFTVANGPLTVVDLSASRSLPASPGATITWTPTIAGGDGSPVEYQFWRYSATTAQWTLVQPYSQTPTWTWTPGGSDAGRYWLQAWVRRQGSSSAYEAWSGTAAFDIAPVPLSVTLTSGQGSPPNVPPNTPIEWHVAATGGTGPFEYAYWLKSAQTGAWTEVRPYWSNDSYAWTPSAADVGSWTLQVWVRTAGSAQPFEAWAGTTFLIQP